MSSEKIGENFFYVGVQNEELRVFDIIMYTPYGTSYNSYLIVGEDKVALIETVKESFFEESLQKIEEVLGDRPLDYVIHNHLEPDHSGSSLKIAEKYPNVEIIASKNGLDYLSEITNEKEGKVKTINVDELDSLDLGGGYVLEFHHAPFLHWPDSIFTYCSKLNALFPCDFLGSHYSFPALLDTELSEEQVSEWFDAFEYYYACIFGPFKKFALDGLSVIDKIEEKYENEIEFVGTSHGPIITRDGLMTRVREYYKTQSSLKNAPETMFEDQVTIAYVSAYGYTGEMATAIKTGVESEGVPVKLYDVTFSEQDEVVSALQESRGILFGTPTILGDALPNIYSLLTNGALNPIIHQGQIAAAFGTYGWSGEGVPNIDERLQQLKYKLPLDPLKIRFRPSGDDLVKCEEYGANFAKAVLGEDISLRTPVSGGIEEEDDLFSLTQQETFDDGVERQWGCIVCGLVENSVNAPEIECPACGAAGNVWEMLSESPAITQPEGQEESSSGGLYQCQVCMYEGEKEENCPACGASGDIWLALETEAEEPVKVEEGVKEEEAVEASGFECQLCKYVYTDSLEAPERCSVCGASGDVWKALGEIEEEAIEPKEVVVETTTTEITGYECLVCLGTRAPKYIHEGSEMPTTPCPVCGGVGEEDVWLALEEEITTTGVVEEAEVEDGSSARSECAVCKYEHEGITPEQCPVCMATGDIWIPLTEEEQIVEEEVEEAPIEEERAMEPSKEVAIIGGGCAGVSAAARLRELSSNVDISLYSVEGLPYFRPNVCKGSASEINSIQMKEWYGENDIDLVTQRVTNLQLLDSGRFQVDISGGFSQEVDSVILTPGASARKMFHGYDNMYTINTKDDAQNVERAIESASSGLNEDEAVNVLFVGAGVVGLEYGSFLADEYDNLALTYVDIAPGLLGMLSTDCSALERSMESKGVEMHFNRTVEELEVDGSIGKNVLTGVELDNGSKLSVDVAIQCVGIVPDLPFLDSFEAVDRHERSGGVLVNSRMESSVPDLYAAGVAAHYEPLLGPVNNWEHAQEMGRVAAENVLSSDSEQEYTQTELKFACDAFDVSVFGIEHLRGLGPAEDGYFVFQCGEDSCGSLRIGYDSDEDIVSMYRIARIGEEGSTRMLMGRCIGKNVFRVLKSLQKLL